MREISATPDGAPRILLAEDNPVNQQVAGAMLRTLGFDVDVVADGAEAVSAAIATPYRAILMDCQLPTQDGYQATREIRRRQEGPRRTPIIAVTGSSSGSDEQRCLAAGMDGYLEKPFNLEALAAALAPSAPDGRHADATPPEDAPAGTPASVVDGSPRPALDPQVVGRLERLGHDTGQNLTEQLAGLFLSDVDARVVSLRAALAAGDAGAVVRSAHTLIGASANIGATHLADLCAALASLGAKGDVADGQPALAAIEVELGRVRTALASASVVP